jgi:hypothetical protein
MQDIFSPSQHTSARKVDAWNVCCTTAAPQLKHGLSKDAMLEWVQSTYDALLFQKYLFS